MSGKQAVKGAAAKGKKAAKGGAEEKREDVLQAVVRCARVLGTAIERSLIILECR
jgi:hypothetical protein